MICHSILSTFNFLQKKYIFPLVGYRKGGSSPCMYVCLLGWTRDCSETKLMQNYRNNGESSYKIFTVLFKILPNPVQNFLSPKAKHLEIRLTGLPKVWRLSYCWNMTRRVYFRITPAYMVNYTLVNGIYTHTQHRVSQKQALANIQVLQNCLNI